ncbi:hypothetical protein [Bradyrhizobium prioriisuperbiae]|uniref:hypothetical protein n=1 Tax=Bradyrhizobium prioriisuperbiae TaxID=2854389 RepID=UPI0028E74E34|nr:hypothetical protein [Bradyrhizobium prioritasuperba]
MARHRGPVLVDTNAILECHRVGAWRALSNGYSLETVEDCVIETQTGFQRRRPELQIDAGQLRASLKAVHAINDAQRAVVAVQAPDIALDLGEQSLWAHALTRSDAWVLCGPDRASMRFGVRLGLRGRLIALETLLSGAGHRPKDALKPAYTTKWLNKTLEELFLSEGFGRS